MRKLVIMALILTSPLFIFCQKPIKVSDVVKNPYKYCNMNEVTVKGKVGGSIHIGFYRYKFWDLNDSCYIWVKPKTISPNKGDTVVLKGKVEELLNFDDNRVLILKEK